MATSITISIKGLDELSSNFRKAPQLVFKELTKAINKSALLATEKIKDVTPVKTGTLRRGIRPRFSTLTAIIEPHNAPLRFFYP